jgi:hypothetical protein
MQPFDNGKYDKRFNDILKPTIEKCGLEAYRIDKDPGVQIPIDDIDLQIRSSDLCLAEITENNPNVWFEIGLAIAYKKEIILVCSTEREGKFPFDIQHRSVISYESESVSDFEKFIDKLQNKINALKGNIMPSQTTIENDMTLTNGLEDHAVSVLVSIASNIDKPVGNASYHFIRDDLERQGLTKLGIQLGIKKLSLLEFIEYTIEYGYNNDEYTVYSITDRGMNWLLENSNKLQLKYDTVSEHEDNKAPEKSIKLIDDIPF